VPVAGRTGRAYLCDDYGGGFAQGFARLDPTDDDPTPRVYHNGLQRTEAYAVLEPVLTLCGAGQGRAGREDGGGRRRAGRDRRREGVSPAYKFPATYSEAHMLRTIPAPDAPLTALRPVSAAPDAPVRPQTDEPMFYIQNKGNGGDLVLWWRPERRGYTVCIDQAGLYSQKEAEEIVRNRPPEDIMHAQYDIDTIVGRVIFHETLRRVLREKESAR
jgi:hypothetical protein